MRNPLSNLCLFLVAASAAFGQGSLSQEREALFASQQVTGASKHAENPLESPATVAVVDRETLRRQGFRTLDEVLTFAVPGFFTITDRHYGYVGSRGYFFFDDYNTRVLLLLNGHVTNEPWNNFAGLGREMLVPMELVERVEVIYGPSAIFYGGYAVYGIINVVTQAPEKEQGTLVELSYGELDTREVLLAHRLSRIAGGRKFSLLAAGGWYASDGEDLELPVVDLGDGAAWGGPQKGTDTDEAPWAFLYSQWGEFTLQGRWGWRDKRIPNAWYDSIYGDPRTRVRDDKSFLDLSWSHAFSPGTELSLRLFADHYEYLEHDIYEDPEAYPGEPGYFYVLPAQNDLWGGEARLTHWWRGHFLTLGGEFRHFTVDQGYHFTLWDGTVDPESVVALSSDHDFTLLYLQDEWRPSDRWTVVVGGNYAVSDPGTDIALPRLAVIYKPTARLSVKLIGGSGYRPPSVIESSFYDQDFIANLDLKPERMTSYELNLTAALGGKSALGLTLFKSELKDMIQAVEFETDDGVLYQYRNSGSARAKGVTLTHEGAWGPWKTLLGATRQDGESILEGGTIASEGVPGTIINALVSYRQHDFTAALSGVWWSSVDSPEGHPDGLDPAIGSDLLLHLNLAYDFVQVLPMRVQVRVMNLLDSDFNQPTSLGIVASRLPVQGRAVLLGYQVRF